MSRKKRRRPLILRFMKHSLTLVEMFLDSFLFEKYLLIGALSDLV